MYDLINANFRYGMILAGTDEVESQILWTTTALSYMQATLARSAKLSSLQDPQ